MAGLKEASEFQRLTNMSSICKLESQVLKIPPGEVFYCLGVQSTSLYIRRTNVHNGQFFYVYDLSKEGAITALT